MDDIHNTDLTKKEKKEKEETLFGTRKAKVVLHDQQLIKVSASSGLKVS